MPFAADDCGAAAVLTACAEPRNHYRSCFETEVGVLKF